jgi:hypothetical protein
MISEAAAAEVGQEFSEFGGGGDLLSFPWCQFFHGCIGKLHGSDEIV